MGGILDCSAAVDDEVDVTSHTGPIHKPLHRMTLREIEYTVNYEKEQFKKSMQDKKLSRLRGATPSSDVGHVGSAK